MIHDPKNVLGRSLYEFEELAKGWTVEQRRGQLVLLSNDVKYLEARIGTPGDLGHCEHNLKLVRAKMDILSELINTNQVVS